MRKVTSKRLHTALFYLYNVFEMIKLYKWRRGIAGRAQKGGQGRREVNKALKVQEGSLW